MKFKIDPSLTAAEQFMAGHIVVAHQAPQDYSRDVSGQALAKAQEQWIKDREREAALIIAQWVKDQGQTSHTYKDLVAPGNALVKALRAEDGPGIAAMSLKAPEPDYSGWVSEEDCLCDES